MVNVPKKVVKDMKSEYTMTMAQATENLQKAFWDAFTPVLLPIVKALNRLINKKND